MAMMDARYTQAMGKTELTSTQMAALPAFAYPKGSFLNTINMNMLAANPYDPAKLRGAGDVFPLGNYGNVNVNEMMLDKRYQNLKEHLFYDVFLAFQNITKEMTVPEVQQRANERMTLLGPAVGRYMGVLKGVVGITLEKAFEAGRLPPVPDELMEDPNYEVEFQSVLTLAQKSADMTALDAAIARVGNIAQFDPRVLSKIDTFKAVDEIFDITGAPPTVRRDSEDAMQIIEQQEQAAEEQRQMEMAGQASQVAVNTTQARKNANEAEAQQ